MPRISLLYHAQYTVADQFAMYLSVRMIWNIPRTVSLAPTPCRVDRSYVAVSVN